jgi:hypothetical protein
MIDRLWGLRRFVRELSTDLCSNSKKNQPLRSGGQQNTKEQQRRDQTKP